MPYRISHQRRYAHSYLANGGGNIVIRAEDMCPIIEKTFNLFYGKSYHHNKNATISWKFNIPVAHDFVLRWIREKQGFIEEEWVAFYEKATPKYGCWRWERW